MTRFLSYRPTAQRELERMERSAAERIVRFLEAFAATGRGDIRALKGALKGRYRLRVGTNGELGSHSKVPRPCTRRLQRWFKSEHEAHAELQTACVGAVREAL